MRLSRALFALAVALFVGVSPAFAVDGWLMDYGREHGLSWNALKLQGLDVPTLRAQGDGRIAWLVGPSILRDAIDEELLQGQLSERGSGIVPVKIGVDRGAPALSAGFVARFPLQPGDLVVTSISASNLRPDWLDFAEVPTRFLTASMSFTEFWRLRELTVRERLEGSVNYLPHTFWTYREEAQSGATQWLLIPWEGQPEKATGQKHLTFRKTYRIRGYTPGKAKKGVVRRRKQGSHRYDDRPSQMNVRGLALMKEICDEAGAELIVVDLPTSPYMDEAFTQPSVHEAYGQFKERLGVVQFAQHPDDFYYDYHHPNAPGRVLWTVEMAELLSSR